MTTDGELTTSSPVRTDDSGGSTAAGRAEEYRSMFDAIDLGFFAGELVRDSAGAPMDYRFRHANAALARMAGLTPEQVEGRIAADVVPATAVRDGMLRLISMVQEGRPQRKTVYQPALDRWLETAVFPQGGDRFTALVTDVTARTEAEQALRSEASRRRFQLELADALQPLVDPGAIKDEACRVLGTHLEAQRVLYLALEGAMGEEVGTVRQWSDGLPPIHTPLKASDFASEVQEELRRGRTAVLHDVATDPRLEGSRAAWEAIGVAASLGRGLVKDGRWVAALVVHSATPRDWTDFEIALVEETVQRTWAAAQQARAEAVLAAREREYEALFEAVDEGLGVCQVVRDGDGAPVDYRFLQVNTAMARFLEMPAEQVIGRLRTEITPPVTAESMARVLAASARTEQTRWEHWSPTRRKWLDSRIFPQGEDRFVFLNSDITARKQLEASLQEDAERRSLLLRLSDTLSPLTDPRQIETATCRLLREHLGADRVSFGRIEDDVLIVTATDHGADMHDLAGALRLSQYGRSARSMTSGLAPAWCDDTQSDPQLSDAERAAHRALGSRAWAAVPVAREGRVRASVGVGFARPHAWSPREIATIQAVADRAWTASRHAALMSEARRQREERETAQREFVANASHELRTPLAGILGSVESLLTGAQDDPTLRARFLEHLRRETQRLARLSDGLLALTATTADDHAFVDVPVRDLLQQVADTLTVPASVQVRVSASPTLTVRAIPGLLEIAVSNLARNAVAHTSSGRIQLRARRRRHDVVVEVQDTGTGMAPSVLQRATDRFYRGRGRAADGFGLGLSITRQAVNACGGALNLTSAPGQGTRAQLTFSPTTTQDSPANSTEDSTHENRSDGSWAASTSEEVR